MAAMIRPSLILQMDLDERAFSEDVVSEIKRSYSYIAPSKVSSHDAGEGEPENVLRLAIKLHKPYWDKNDAAAQELWAGVMPKWLRNMFRKISNTIVAGSKVRVDQGDKPLNYAWVEAEFGDDALVAMKSMADSSIPEEAVQMVDQVRDLMGSGAFGDASVACVRMPSRASYEEQLAQAIAEAEAAAEAEAEAEAAETGESAGAESVAAGIAAAAEADGAGVGAAVQVGASDVPDAAVVDETNDASDATGEDATSDEAPAEEEPALPKIDPDYTVWGIEYADGTVREFDSAAGSFVS